MRYSVLVVLASCGRLGFDASSSPIATDAVVGDAVRDGTDAAIPTSCAAMPPFVYLIAPREEGSGGVSFEVRWCSAGVTGQLVISMIVDDTNAVFRSVVAPIEDGSVLFDTSGSSCGTCHIRLEADGAFYDGPSGSHAGD